MKCPKCDHEFTPSASELAKELGKKGGSKSKRKISTLQQITMQAGRLKGPARQIFDTCKERRPKAGVPRDGFDWGYEGKPSKWEGSSMGHAAWLAGRYFKAREL